MVDLISYTFTNKYIVRYFDAYFSKILDGFLLVCDAGFAFFGCYVMVKDFFFLH